MKKFLITLLLVATLVCALAIGVSATEVDYNEKATLLDGTVLPIYDENQNPLIWFIKDETAEGADKYASVPNNRNTADNATSYVTYNINSTYGKNQLHDVYIKYWDAESGAYVSYGEDKVVVYNLRGIDTLWCVGTYASGSTLEYTYLPSSCKDAGTYNGYTKLQVVDFLISTQYEGFGKQAFRDCKELREVRFGTSENGYQLKSQQNGCLFHNCTNLTTLVFADISKITAIEGGAFENCYSLTGTYEFTGVTSIGSKAFYKAATNEGTNLVLKFPNLSILGGNSGDTHVFSYSGVKELYFGDDITQMSFNTFTGCKSLWKVEFAGITEGFNFKSYTFEDCSALKAFSIPEGVTVLPGRMFRNCSSLKAVYLPSTLTKIDAGSQDHSTFANCTNVYFVSEPFTFTSDEDIPAKPDVYYFPESLATLNGETFKMCQSLNKTLVFGKNVTSIANSWAFESGINNPTLENIVFLGDMENLSTSWTNNTAWKFTGKIYLVNANDKSTSDVNLSGLASKTVFCNAEGNTAHLTETILQTPAKCEKNASTTSYCFCGREISKVEVEGTALSHDYDYVNGKGTLVAITYADLSKDGTKTVTCGLCGVNNDSIVAEKVFTYKGYSTNSKGAMCMGYFINQSALDEYETLNGKVEYGFVASANNDTPLNENGEQEENTVKVSLSENVYTAVDFVLGATDWSDEAVCDVKITLNMYVIINNAVKYVTANGYSDTAEAVKYSEI